MLSTPMSAGSVCVCMPLFGLHAFISYTGSFDARHMHSSMPCTHVLLHVRYYSGEMDFMVSAVRGCKGLKPTAQAVVIGEQKNHQCPHNSLLCLFKNRRSHEEQMQQQSTASASRVH